MVKKGKLLIFNTDEFIYEDKPVSKIYIGKELPSYIRIIFKFDGKEPERPVLVPSLDDFVDTPLLWKFNESGLNLHDQFA